VFDGVGGDRDEDKTSDRAADVGEESHVILPQNAEVNNFIHGYLLEL
jgi:hypothetical protein